MSINRLSYVSLNVMELAVAERHYCEVVGLRVTGRERDRVYLQTPDAQDHHCVILNRSDRSGLDHIGVKAASPDDLAAAAAVAREHGLTVVDIPDRMVMGQGAGVMITLPSSHRLNVFHRSEIIGYANGMENPQPIGLDTVGVNPVSHLDHMLIVCQNPEPTAKFLKEALDFNISELVLDPAGNTFAAFTTLGNTMHNIAIAPGPDGGLHHIAFYVYDRADVIRRIDLLKHRGVPTLEYGLTRHGVAGVTTTYFFDPSGNRNEFQCGAYETPGIPDLIPPVTWDLPNMTKGTFYYESAIAPNFYEAVS